MLNGYVTDIRSSADLKPPMVPITDFVKAPPRIEVVAEDFRGFDVSLMLIARRGGFDCAEITVRQREDGPTVTGESLRSIALGELVAEGEKHLWTDLPDPTDGLGFGGNSSFHLGTPLSEDIRDCWSASEPENVDVALRWVADRYVRADATGRPPTKEVQIAFGVSRATASRMVRRARDRGFLPVVSEGLPSG